MPNINVRAGHPSICVFQNQTNPSDSRSRLLGQLCLFLCPNVTRLRIQAQVGADFEWDLYTPSSMETWTIPHLQELVLNNDHNTYYAYSSKNIAALVSQNRSLRKCTFNRTDFKDLSNIRQSTSVIHLTVTSCLLSAESVKRIFRNFPNMERLQISIDREEDELSTPPLLSLRDFVTVGKEAQLALPGVS